MSIFQLQAKDSVVRIGGSSGADCLNGIQSLSWDSAMNAENLEELGNQNYTGKMVQPSVSGSFEARSSGSVAAMLGRMIYTIDAQGEFGGYLGSGNGHLIRETDFQFACFDLIESQRANEIFDRSTIIPRAYLSQLSISANADGTATESYSFDADLLEVYRAPLHDLISVAPLRKAGGAASTTVVLPAGFAVETATLDAAAQWKVHALDIDGRRVPASKLDVTPAATDRGTTGQDELVLSTVAQTEGIEVTKGAKLSVIMYRKTPGSFPTISYPTQARFVKADSINIWLVDPLTVIEVGGQTRTVEAHLDAGVDLNAIPFAESDLFLRVQSVDFSVDLARDELREIRKNDRGTPVYFRAAKYPLNVSSSLSATVTDLNDWAKIQGKNAMGSGTPDILNLADFEGKEWMIVTRYYKANTTLQTVALMDALVDGMGQNVSVGGRSERTWSFTGSKIAIKGNAAA